MSLVTVCREVMYCFVKPYYFPVGTGSTVGWRLWIYCCLAKVYVWALGIFECVRKSLLPDLWQYESFCSGEEQVRRSVCLHCMVAGLILAMGQGSGGNMVVLGWKAAMRAFCHICFCQGHTCSHCMFPSSKTVCRYSNINKKSFSQRCLCGSIVQFQFWSNVKDIMHLLALSAKYHSSCL